MMSMMSNMINSAPRRSSSPSLSSPPPNMMAMMGNMLNMLSNPSAGSGSGQNIGDIMSLLGGGNPGDVDDSSQSMIGSFCSCLISSLNMTDLMSIASGNWAAFEHSKK